MENLENNENKSLGMSDKKDAVNIGVTLSTQIITASLTMIAVIGAFAAFVIDKRDVGLTYYLITGGAFFCFIISIVLGGKGIDKARKSGFAGTWTIDETKDFFNRQSIIALLGVILFSISIFVGKEKPDELKSKIDNQEKTINELTSKDELKTKEIRKLTEDIYKLTKQIDEMKKATVPNNTLPKAGQTVVKKQ